MRRIITIAFSAIILFITGCAGNKAAGNSKASLFSESVAEVISNEPEWWTTPDEKEGYVYGKGSGASRSKDGSRMKAKNDVINDLSQKSKVITEGRTSFFISETGTDDDSELLEKLIMFKIRFGVVLLMDGLKSNLRQLWKIPKISKVRKKLFTEHIF